MLITRDFQQPADPLAGVRSTTRKSLMWHRAFMGFVLLFAWLGLFGAMPQALADDTAGPSVVVVGDSISAAYGIAESDGWVTLLQQALEPDHPQLVVHNASISGDTTDGGLQRLPRLMTRLKPDIVVLELGGNDGLRGQSLKQMAANLEGMVDTAQSYGARALILGMQIPSNYGPAYTKQFAEVYSSVAEKTGAALVPFLLAPFAEERTFFQPDGVHPTAEAQPLMLDIVLPEIESLLQELATR